MFSPGISFAGLLIVIHQLRISNNQRELQSLVHVSDINRQVHSLGFAHPKLFAIIADAPKADAGFPNGRAKRLMLA